MNSSRGEGREAEDLGDPPSWPPLMLLLTSPGRASFLLHRASGLRLQPPPPEQDMPLPWREALLFPLGPASTLNS